MPAKTSSKSPSNASTKKSLTEKQGRFVEGVLRHGNAHKAASEAGYARPDPQAYEILRNPKIRERIEARRRELVRAAQVQTDEIIGTLVSHMRADITDLIDEEGEIDFTAAREAGVSHLVKEYTVRRTTGENGENVTRTVKLHDSQAAAKALCEVFGLKQEPRPNQTDERKRREVRESIEHVRAEHGDEAAELFRQSLLDDEVAGKYVN